MTWQRERFRSQCPTHRIPRFDWQHDMIDLLKSLNTSDVDQGPSAVIPTSSRRDLALQSISPMIRKVAAAFLPHPALGMQQYFSESPDSSKRDATGVSRRSRSSLSPRPFTAQA